MSENICVLNENGTIKDFEDRKEVHEKGILHLTVQCWITNSKQEVLIQRRSEKKDQCPGKWDVSFGGHCTQTDSQDILISNLIKESEEEIHLGILHGHAPFRAEGVIIAVYYRANRP